MKMITNEDNCMNCEYSRDGKPPSCAFNPPVAIPMQRINPITQQPENGITGILPPILERGICGRYKRK